jgi:hypothetical protein
MIWQQILVESHPELFVRTFRGLLFAPGYPVCPVGWQDIVKRLVERVSAASSGYPVHFTRIQEEYGVLRVHWRARAEPPIQVERAIDEAVALASARSACTCGTCGATGRLFCHGSRLLTACTEHAQGVPVPTSPGLEDVHIVRAVIGGRSTVAFRRYDWITDSFVELSSESLSKKQQTDAFIDIDPGYLGIEEE